MRPVDPAMLRRLPALNGYLRRTVAFAVGSAGLITVQAVALATALSAAVGFHSGPVRDGLLWFGAAVILRAGLSWWQGVSAARGAAAVKTRLRGRLFNAAQPGWAGGRRTGEAVTLVTRGVDGLDAYITGYLPQLCLAATVPLTVLVVLAINDLASMIVVLVTIPLMPVFGILIGWHTKAKTDRQWRRLQRLGGHFLDAVAGLPTSRVFGRAAHAATAVRDTADGYRTATMGTLKIAFLSALALELVATVSVALVAVPIGLQLLGGSMDLRTAFIILLLVPEVYLPLRAMGTQFHAAQEGLAASQNAFRLLDAARGETGADPVAPATDTATPHTGKEPSPMDHTEPLDGYPQAVDHPQTVAHPQAPTRELDTSGVGPITIGIGAEVGGPHVGSGSQSTPGASGARLRFDRVTVQYPDRDGPALAEFSGQVQAGQRIALLGPSGAGKSTLLNALLGFAPLTAGSIEFQGTRRSGPGSPGSRTGPDSNSGTDSTASPGSRPDPDPDPGTRRPGLADDAWLRNIAWVPQRPHLFAMSITDNIRLGQPDADPDQVRAAADAAFATEFIAELPHGFDTRLGDEGFGLSAGQRRRLALARAFLRLRILDCPLVLMDEPTASLDLHSEARVAEAAARLLAGRTAIVVAHRSAMVSEADQIWRVSNGRLTSIMEPAVAGAGS